MGKKAISIRMDPRLLERMDKARVRMVPAETQVQFVERAVSERLERIEADITEKYGR